MKKSLILATLLAAAPFAASAGELNYNYVEAGYANVDVERHDGKGFQLRGSVAVDENFYLFGGYASATNDDFGLDIDLTETQLGLGYRHGLNDRADLIAEVGYLRHELDVKGYGSESLSGARVSVGFRGKLADNFEGWVKGSYNDGGDFEGSFSALAGAQLNLTQTWGVVAEIENGEIVDDADTTKYLIGVRASF